MSEIAISVGHLSKVYKLYNKPSDRLKETLGMKVAAKEHYALRDVSFTVNKGRDRRHHRDKWFRKIDDFEDYNGRAESLRGRGQRKRQDLGAAGTGCRIQHGIYRS